MTPTPQQPEGPTDLKERLRASLSAAIRGRDRVAVSALRSAIAAVENAEAVDPTGPTGGTGGPQSAEEEGPVAGSAVGVGAAEAERRRLTGDQVAAIVRAEVAERTGTAAEFDGLGRQDRADRLRAEAAAIEAVLGA